VLVQGDVRVPETLRFRAGGDESVRGYSYRSLAPSENGIVVSGKVLFTASVEMARPITDRVPGLMGAVFIDAGRAAQNWNDLRPALGYGFGVRYGSPVGQLKLDLAYGQESRQVRLHLSVGVPF
jgi:translocation and assembly module TamA